ncbi:MAG: DUF1461 domain-containing protein [bacterium]|nr:DUF1461 domain-containing protein [bacterium]
MKFNSLFLSVLLLVGLFLLNSLITLVIMKANPVLLITNHSYQSQHEQIINYLLTGNEQQLNKYLTHTEFIHIKDVRTLVAKIPLTLFLLIAVSSYLVKHHQNVSIKEVIKYSIISLFGLFLIGALLFMPLFTLFHQTLFPQGNWAFPSDSILIQLYPEQFWRFSALLIAGAILIELAVVHWLKNHSFTSPKHLMV